MSKVDVIRVGMRLFYDGEPCIVQGLRRISTGRPVEEATKEEFQDMVATLAGQGWEAKVRLTEEALGRLSEAIFEEAVPAGVETSAEAFFEERMPIDWESISGGEPTELEEAIQSPEEREGEEEVDVEELPGDMDIEFEEE